MSIVGWIEIDHIAGFLGGLRAGCSWPLRHPPAPAPEHHGAVTGHGHEFAFLLPRLISAICLPAWLPRGNRPHRLAGNGAAVSGLSPVIIIATNGPSHEDDRIVRALPPFHNVL